MEDSLGKMKEFMTVFNAVDATDGVIKLFHGERIYASNWECAEIYCKSFLPQLVVIGQIIDEIYEVSLASN